MLNDFENPQTRIRINPKTKMTFESDNHVLLDHPLSDTGVQIQSDIMLVLYNMTDWTTVEALCEGWPPDDQAKIKAHLNMLFKSKVVITDESQMAGSSLSLLPQNFGEAIQIHIESHHAMLRDTVRVRSYQQAISQNVKPDDVVMDLGTGSGILAFMAARSGAQKVYAVERRPDMMQVAQLLAKENKLFDKITFVEGISHQLDPALFDPKPSVMVSEILGNAILEEHVLEFTIDARDRFLVPGGRLIPYQVDIMICAYDSGPGPDRVMEIAELESMYGFQFGMLKAVLGQKVQTRLERFNPLNVTMMSEPQQVISLDLRTLTETTFKQPFTWVPTQDGYVNGFCAYFKAHLDETTVLTNSPWAPPTHWTQMVFTFPKQRPVKAGEPIDMTLSYEGSLALWFTSDYETEGG